MVSPPSHPVVSEEQDNHPESHQAEAPKQIHFSEVNLLTWRPQVPHLKFLSPLPNHIVIFAYMLCVEVRKRHWLLRINPHLAQDARVDIAHEDLTDSVDAVG
jgi:hypothetical protein